MDDGCLVCSTVFVCGEAFEGEMVNFVGYQYEEWDPKSGSVAVYFLFFSRPQSSSVHPYALVETTHQ